MFKGLFACGVRFNHVLFVVAGAFAMCRHDYIAIWVAFVAIVVAFFEGL